MIREFTILEIRLLLEATTWTVLLSLIAFAGGGLVGAIVTLMRISRQAVIRRIAQVYILLFQGTPLLMQLFLVYFGLALYGYSVHPMVAAAIALTCYSSAFFAEIWRGTIETIPRPQWEGSASLGLTRSEQLRYVIIPQSIRLALPPTVGFAVQIIKNTSVTSLIGFTELTRSGQLINNVTFEPFLVFGCVAAIYFALCFPLSALSRYLERKLHVPR
ncbi:MAG: putative amino acid transporter, permease protein [Devosia sp.]|nr:putative amino acid transporter, permease protein [Devosia sp.]